MKTPNQLLKEKFLIEFNYNKELNNALKKQKPVLIFFKGNFRYKICLS